MTSSTKDPVTVSAPSNETAREPYREPIEGWYTDAVKTYFRDKADTYDLVDEQPYWRLSDELLWFALQRFAISSQPPAFHFLDAGGGTGRWTDRVMRSYECSGVLFDLSEDMTAQAVQKARSGGYEDRLDIRCGDLHDVGVLLAEAKFDLVFSFHNVLGFVKDVPHVLTQLRSLLTESGKIVLFVPNLYHTTFFNLSLGEVERARLALTTGRGRFTEDMPEIHLFTPDSINALLTRQGFDVDLITGFPVLMYPGYEETQARGSSDLARSILEDESNFWTLFDLESAILGDSGLASRGNNLFAVASVRHQRRESAR